MVPGFLGIFQNSSQTVVNLVKDRRKIFLPRNVNRNGRSLPNFTCNIKLAMMILHCVLDDGKPQSGATGLFGVALVNTVEPFKNLLLVFRSDSDSGILYTLQWINGYPRREKIEEDIQLGHSYVVTEDGEIEGVFCFFHGTAPEPSYDRINGAWLNDEPYGVIHRIVSSGKISGMVARCADWCLQKCANLRIDTHADNRPMQQALERAGFRYCGVVAWR